MTTFATKLAFVSIAARFVEEIKLDLGGNTEKPPPVLPGHVHRALSWCLELTDLAVMRLWTELHNDVWSTGTAGSPLPPISKEHVARLLTFDNEGISKKNHLGALPLSARGNARLTMSLKVLLCSIHLCNTAQRTDVADR